MLILRHTIRIQDNLTDRAKRYRAQHPDVRPLDPKQCGFCGSKRNIGVHHILGNENHGQAENLMWACKSCNGKIGHRMRKAGLGKLTQQFNPAKRGKSSLAAYAAAIKVMRGEWEGDVQKAMDTIHSTPREMRSRYTIELFDVSELCKPAGESWYYWDTITWPTVPF